MFRTTILTAALLASATTAFGATATNLTAGPMLSNPSTTITPASPSAAELRREKAIQIADINGDKAVTVQDQYDFFEAWGLAMEKGEASVQDLYNWLEAYHFATTPVSSK